ncbi:hypothetical protein IWQ52_001587 [Labrenzia sp. EL_159]|nr:hypothetical protein [Labrenzia sp. EL_162]MBG6194073.1 hypothetical protein [Labrenzia sp. EL_159]
MPWSFKAVWDESAIPAFFSLTPADVRFQGIEVNAGSCRFSAGKTEFAAELGMLEFLATGAWTGCRNCFKPVKGTLNGI